MPRFANIAKPLNDLLAGHSTGKKVLKTSASPWIWGSEQQNAFDILIDKFTSPHVLAYADFRKPFLLNVDASSTGLGAVLYQEQDDGQERVIAYVSRGLRSNERNYPTHKLEFLALKWAVEKKFSDYLYGNSFVVRTDNNPLTYVLASAKLDATSHRWLAALSTYNFSLKYRSGKTNIDADFLSRNPPEDHVVFNDCVQALFHSVLSSPEEAPAFECVSFSQFAIPQESSPYSDIDWKVEQRKDATISRAIELVARGHKPTKRLNCLEGEEVRKYLREWQNLHLVIYCTEKERLVAFRLIN